MNQIPMAYFFEGELWQRLVRMLSLADHNTRVVLAGTLLLGISCGVIGSFTLLRKRALVSDALSHATLPGIGIAFLTAQAFGYSGKNVFLLLFGAAIAGCLGMASILLIRNQTRLKEDAAMGIVLSVFFGAGTAIMVAVRNSPEGNMAGLSDYIYGQTAGMLATDAWLIAAVGLVSLSISILLFKEIRMFCFDTSFAHCQGLSTRFFDSLLMFLIVMVTIVGLQAVGIIMMVALLITPAAAARFWTYNLVKMTWIAALIGGFSGVTGAFISGLGENLPSGALIVLTASSCFVFSLFFGSKRGVFVRTRRRWETQNETDREHLLRDFFEILEGKNLALTTSQTESSAEVPLGKLLAKRAWKLSRFRKVLRFGTDQGWLLESDDKIQLTARGAREAAKVVRRHRLWELYLIHFAGSDPNRVDRGADMIEHWLDPDVLAELESLLKEQSPPSTVASSPHPIEKDIWSSEEEKFDVGSIDKGDRQSEDQE